MVYICDHSERTESCNETSAQFFGTLTHHLSEIRSHSLSYWACTYGVNIYCCQIANNPDTSTPNDTQPG